MNLIKLENFFERINIIKKLSPDEETQVAAVLVDESSMDTVASGYNGFIRGANDHSLPKKGKQKHEYIVHSEANLICNAANQGISTKGKILICNLSPCCDCYRLIRQSGISTVYFEDFHKSFKNTISSKDSRFSLIKVGKYYKMELL